VTGGKVFGYDNLRIAKGHAERTINEAEAATVRNIYERFACGEGARSIAARSTALAFPRPARSRGGRAAGRRAPCALCLNGPSIGVCQRKPSRLRFASARWKLRGSTRATHAASGPAEHREAAGRPNAARRGMEGGAAGRAEGGAPGAAAPRRAAHALGPGREIGRVAGLGGVRDAGSPRGPRP
jgi:hypothetical protein